MKKPAWLIYTVKIAVIILTVVLCLELFPHKTSSFKYRFSVGKPWGYELLTADKDFPIYKTEEQLEAERKEVLKEYRPYYYFDARIAENRINQLVSSTYDPQTQYYLKRELPHIFQNGIITAEDDNKLKEAGYDYVHIVDSTHSVNTHAVDEFFTPKTAYTYLFENAPIGNTLAQLNINRYLEANVLLDTLTSNRVKESLLSQISLTQGIVQQGQGIVNRGDIVTPEIYQILYSLKLTTEQDMQSQRMSIWTLLGEAAMIVIILCLLLLYLYVFRKPLSGDLRALSLLWAMMMIIIIICSCIVGFTEISVYIVPFAWVVLTIGVFYDARTAFITYLSTILLSAIIVPQPFEFLFIHIIVGYVAISSLHDLTQRSQIIHTSLLILLSYAVTYTAITLAEEGTWEALDWKEYVCFAVNALIVVFSYGLIYIIEKLFGLTSAITLVELTNVSSNLMLRFAEKAPGTFQHSLQVSTLAAEAAKKIGANALLVRTGGLYHDIGKMVNAHCFTENQFGDNPLSKLSYIDAAQIVIGHVAEGVRIAKKNKIPETIIHFIETHHGTGKALYFYNSYCNEHQGEEIDDTPFTYPGPMPDSKETAILMLADGVEARTRSLTEFTEESISKAVDQMINTQIASGQLSNTPLSFKDIEEIRRVFKDKIMSINHHRISYPERKTE